MTLHAGDPDCMHALADAEAEITRLLALVSGLAAQRDQARATAKRLHRRAKLAESELKKLKDGKRDTWSSRERQVEARERDAGMNAVEKVLRRLG